VLTLFSLVHARSLGRRAFSINLVSSLNFFSPRCFSLLYPIVPCRMQTCLFPDPRVHHNPTPELLNSPLSFFTDPSLFFPLFQMVF